MHEQPASAAGAVLPAVPMSCDSGGVGEPLRRRSDTQGLACDFDAAWLRFTERSRDASLRNGWLQDVHPEDRQRCLSIHAEMLASRAPYTLDYRLRHALRGHRWVMEQATPMTAADGSFGGFTHHCMDVQERTELGERLADRLGRMRSTVRSHGAFAAALARESERLTPARLRLALQIFSALTGRTAPRNATRVRVSEWLGMVVDEACAARPIGAAPFLLSLPPEPFEIDFDLPALRAALTNALVCVALLAVDTQDADARNVRAEQAGGTLIVELPALPDSSAFALLELALRWHGLPGGQMVCHGAVRRWRVALPLSAPLP